MGLWKVVGIMAGFCAVFLSLLIGLALGGLKSQVDRSSVRAALA